MSEKIYEAIRLQNGKITYKNLAKKFDIDTEKLKNILLKLKLDGKILQLGNKYMVFPKDMIIGKVIVSKSGKKHIYYQGKMLTVASKYINEIILHDVVSFRINNKNEAEIFSVVDRIIGKMTCQIRIINGKKRIVPYHDGLYINLPIEIIDELYEGDIILVDIKEVSIGDYCDAKFIKKIGRIDDPAIEDIEIALNYDFDNDYDEKYLQEIDTYPTSVKEEELIGRSDFRNQFSFTIDGINTKDMDDGVYAEIINDDIIRVYVHIADVSHYVKSNSLVFKRACEKATSLYMNNSVFHMLHHKISNGICSLNPNTDRLTKTVIMDIDQNGKIIDFNIVKSVINSKKKMNYDDVDNILINNEIEESYKPFIRTLLILNEAAKRLENRYTTENGKINFANDENNIIYTSNGEISKIEKIENSESRKLIENLMIAANETVANWLYNMQIPSVYRIHEYPDAKKINLLIDKLNKSGFKIKHLNNIEDPKNIQRMLNKFRNSDEFEMISQLFVMSMQRARYSTENLGHYALGLDTYAHFTSPIRRLPDLLIHMMSDIVLENYEKLNVDDLDIIEKKLKELARHSSDMERRADIAETEAEKRLIILKLEKYIGNEMEAIVCETDNNIRIKLFGLSVYINKSNLNNNFDFDNKRKLYYEKNTNNYLKIGSKIIVRLVEASSINRSIKVDVLSIINAKIKKLVK